MRRLGFDKMHDVCVGASANNKSCKSNKMSSVVFTHMKH